MGFHECIRWDKTMKSFRSSMITTSIGVEFQYPVSVWSFGQLAI
jgi:hypothetical protein